MLALWEATVGDVKGDKEDVVFEGPDKFGQGPLTPTENRILVDGGVAVPIPGLARHLEKLFVHPVSEVDWINPESTSPLEVVARPKDLTEKAACLVERIQADTAQVFCQQDFSDLAPSAVIEGAFQLLVENATLIPIGEGLYAKGRINRISGEPMFAAPGGFDQVAKAALDKLGIRWEVGPAERRYQSGGSQVPARTVVRIAGDHWPDIGYQRYRLLIV